MAERDQLIQAIAAMEAQRAALGDAVVDAAIAAFRTRLENLPKDSNGDQRKLATILVAEVGGIHDAQDKADAQRQLAAIWENFDALIVEQGGTIGQHQHNTLTALFGIPTAHENDPERAAWAALALQRATNLYVKRISLRIGIHTGLVEGRVPSPASKPTASQAKPAAGDETTNFANRLQQSAVPGEIIVSQSTYGYLRGIFDLQTMDPLSLRGKAEPVQIYRLRSARPRTAHTPSAFPGLKGASVALIGRANELRSMLDIYRASVKNRNLNIITINGEVGIGKTRLVQEFCGMIGTETKTNPLIMHTASTLENSRIPFSLLRNLLANHYQLDITAPKEVIRTRLENEFRVLLRIDGIEAAHLVGHLAGFDFSDSPFIQRYAARPPLGHENVNALRQRALQLCPRFFQALAGNRPLIICIDDAQWVDPDSLKLVDSLVNENVKFPALLYLITRPMVFENQSTRWNSPSADLTRNWGRIWNNHTLITLDALSPEAVSQLSAGLLGLPSEKDIPPALLEAIHESASGNPFFVSEMLRMWFEDGTIQHNKGELKVSTQSLSRQRMPSTLTEVMQARLDGLPIPERDLLKRAAIIGRVFWEEALQALAPHTSEDTGELVHLLMIRGLIANQSPTSIQECQEYRFSHNLLHQVAYENVLQRMRPGYHARAAAWMEQQAERLKTNSFAAIIAEHHEKASQTNLSSIWYARAGDDAIQRYQPDVALEYFQKALQSTQELEIERRLELFKKIGDGLWWMARYAQALEIGKAQAEIAQAHGQPASWADALYRMSAIQNRLGDHILGLQYANQAVEIAHQANMLPELAAALFQRGISQYRLGDTKGAKATAEEGLELSTRMEKDPAFPTAHAEIVRFLNVLGMVSQTTGDHRAAREYFGRVLEFHRAANNPGGAIAALNNLGVHAHVRGEYKTAIDYYQQALELIQSVGYRDIEWVCLSNLSGAQIEVGEYKEVEDRLRYVLENAEKSGWFMLGETKRFMALSLLGQRRRQEALEYARDSLEQARKSGGREYMGRAWRVLGMIAAQSPSGTILLPDHTLPLSSEKTPTETQYTARICFSTSMEIFQEIGGTGDQARTQREWARYEIQHGDRNMGLELWERARANFKTLDMQEELQRMQEEFPHTPNLQGDQP